MTQTITRTFRT